MSKIPMWRRHLRFWGPDPKADVNDEIQFHLEMRTKELVEDGWSPVEARNEARRQFGDLSHVRSECHKIDRGLDRARRRLVFVDELRQDGRHALRQLFRSPGFALTAIVTLALGIGATATVFSLVNALLLRPYPYRAADRIVNVFGVDERTGQRRFLSYPDLIDFGEQNDVLEALAGSDREPYNVRTPDATVYVQGARASANLFDVLGVDPLLGRTFRSGEDGPGADRVVILSERFWRSTLDADPDAVGGSIVIDGEPHVVIGVVPRGAAFPDEADLWITLRLDPQQQARGSHWVNSVGRLKPGVSAEQARAGLDVIARRLEQQYPDSNTGSGVAVEPLRDVRSEDNRAILAILLGAVGFVLLIACANVSGLLLARATARTTEMSLRAALGAGRGRLVRQLMTEVALLVVPGAALGLGISLWVTSQVAVWAPGQIPDWIVLDLDVRMTLFIVAASVMTALMCGLAPAMQATKVDLAGSIKESGAGASGGARTRRLRSALVVAEVALSIALLVGAGLMIKSFAQLTQVSPGFETDRAFMMTTAFAASTYATTEQRVDFYDRARDRLIALPGVQAVGGVARPPLRGGWSTVSFSVEGQTADDQRDNPPMLWHTATSGYLGAAGVPLLRGRDFSAADIDGPRGVVLVTPQMVDRYWPDADPIGKRVKFGPPAGDSEWMDVVGVVGGVKQIDMLADEGLQWYTPYGSPGSPSSRITWVVRTDGDLRGLIPAARAAIRAVDADQALYDVMTLGDAVDASLWGPRLATTLFWVFGGIALLLASVGIYGVMSYAVAQRTREIGVRVALGARSGAVLGMVLRHGARLVALGTVVGLVLAVLLGRVMASILVDVDATDTVVLLGVVVVQIVVVLAASVIPAWRSLRVNPVAALRNE